MSGVTTWENVGGSAAATAARLASAAASTSAAEASISAAVVGHEKGGRSDAGTAGTSSHDPQTSRPA
eukprot:879617-Prymnesium_polylepis.3